MPITGAIALVQALESSTADPGVSVTFTDEVPLGSVVAVTLYVGASPDAVTGVSVSDNLNGAYALGSSVAAANTNAYSATFWVRVTAAGLPTVTATWSPNTQAGQIAAYAFSGFLGAPAVDPASTGGYSNATAETSWNAPVVCNFGKEILVGAFSTNGPSWTPSNNWTEFTTARSWYLIQGPSMGVPNPFTGTLGSSGYAQLATLGIYDQGQMQAAGGAAGWF